MNRFVCRALLALTLATAGAAAPAQPTDDSLYRAFGGTTGLQRLMDDFVGRLYEDPRLKDFFKETQAAQLKRQLVAQFCEVSGGPCRREGPSMKDAHEGQQIGRRDFNALVEVLQDAMDAQQVPFPAQRRLLALLAPMHRDIVSAP